MFAALSQVKPTVLTTTQRGFGSCTFLSNTVFATLAETTDRRTEINIYTYPSLQKLRTITHLDKTIALPFLDTTFMLLQSRSEWYKNELSVMNYETKQVVWSTELRGRGVYVACVSLTRNRFALLNDSKVFLYDFTRKTQKPIATATAMEDTQKFIYVSGTEFLSVSSDTVAMYAFEVGKRSVKMGRQWYKKFDRVYSTCMAEDTILVQNKLEEITELDVNGDVIRVIFDTTSNFIPESLVWIDNCIFFWGVYAPAQLVDLITRKKNKLDFQPKFVCVHPEKRAVATLSAKEVLVYKLKSFTHESDLAFWNNLYKNKGFFDISILHNENVEPPRKKMRLQ